MTDEERRVHDVKSEYDEFAEEVFTLNIGCPHCKKPISLSLAKLDLSKVKESK